MAGLPADMREMRLEVFGEIETRGPSCVRGLEISDTTSEHSRKNYPKVEDLSNVPRPSAARLLVHRRTRRTRASDEFDG